MPITSNTRLIAGVNIDPSTNGLDVAYRIAEFADTAGYDLIGIQDHPYNPAFLDTWTLLTTLAARTKNISFTPNVANLGLRPPTMLLKAASSLQILTGGRAILGVGAGSAERTVSGYGGISFKTPVEMGDAFAEALQLFQRLQQSGFGPISFDGRYHHLQGAQFGPIPATRVPIWTGTFRKRGLQLTGTYTDGWLCPVNLYVTPAEVPARRRIIDDAALAAGRDPKSIRRIYNLVGSISDGGAGKETPGKPLLGPASFWVDRIGHYITELGFDGFVFWSPQNHAAQVELFAAKVLPQLRAQFGN